MACFTGDDLWEAKVYLRKLILSVSGLHAIVVSDRDGVPVVRMSDEQAPEKAQRPAFLSYCSLMTEQAGKIGFGSNKSIIAFFDNVQVVQINNHPLLLTFIADADSNTGEIMNLEFDLQDLVDEIKVLTETQQ